VTGSGECSGLSYGATGEAEALSCHMPDDMTNYTVHFPLSLGPARMIFRCLWGTGVFMRVTWVLDTGHEPEPVSFVFSILDHITVLEVR